MCRGQICGGGNKQEAITGCGRDVGAVDAGNPEGGRRPVRVRFSDLGLGLGHCRAGRVRGYRDHRT